MKINRLIHYMRPSKTYEKIDWEPYYEGFIGSRLMPDGVCNFIYHIYKDDDGNFRADATNNAYGAKRVAVKSRNCKNIYGSKYKESEVKNLMNNIENGKCLWLYISHCNVVGKVTTMEY